MITADQLTARYSRALALTLCQELHATEAFADFCIRYMRHPDPLVARNALCVLTKAGSRDLVQLQPLTDDLILLAMTTAHVRTQVHPGGHGHYLLSSRCEKHPLKNPERKIQVMIKQDQCNSADDKFCLILLQGPTRELPHRKNDTNGRISR